jgi:hypothetical protein
VSAKWLVRERVGSHFLAVAEFLWQEALKYRGRLAIMAETTATFHQARLGFLRTSITVVMELDY